MSHDETFSVQRERLRALLTHLEFVPAGTRHEELLKRTRATIADIRKTRAALSAASRRQAPGFRINYAVKPR